MTGPAYDQALTIAPAALRAPWTRRVRDALLLLLALVALVAMGIDLELAPGALMTGFGKLGRFLGEMFPPSSGGQSVRIFKALAETFAMAFAGTVIAALVALPLGVIGAKTVVPNIALHFAFRRFLDIFRGVPALVWALILVSAFGLGPWPIFRTSPSCSRRLLRTATPSPWKGCARLGLRPWR